MRKEVQAFWTQAQADYSTASVLMDVGIYYASVFFSQQAAEKALKAVAIKKQQKNPKGHHLIQIANSLDAPIEVMNASAELNVEFLTTRNPDASDGVPAQLYNKASAEQHLRAADTVLKWAKNLL